MATWTPPSGIHNPSSGGTPTVAWGDGLNTAVDLLANTPQAVVSHSTTQTATTSVEKTLNADTETYDSDVMHSTVSNTSRLTCKTAGRFDFTAAISFASNATGYRSLLFAKNGGTATTIAQVGAFSGAGVFLSGTISYVLAVNDYVEVVAWQNSGGNLAVQLFEFRGRLVAFT